MEMRIYQLATGLLHLKPLYYQGKKQPPWSCTMMRPIHTSLMAADLVVGFRHPCPEVYNSRTPPPNACLCGPKRRVVLPP